MVWIVAAVVLAALAAGALAVRSRTSRDPVDTFRRQIDALSPEARRPTIDQVRRVDDDSGETDRNAS